MKTLFLDMDIKGLEVNAEVTPQKVFSNWIQNMIVLEQRAKHGQKGAPAETLRFITRIFENLLVAVEKGDGKVELADDQYGFVKRSVYDAHVDPQFSMVVSRVLDVIDRSEDFNREQAKASA